MTDAKKKVKANPFAKAAELQEQRLGPQPNRTPGSVVNPKPGYHYYVTVPLHGGHAGLTKLNDRNMRARGFLPVCEAFPPIADWDSGWPLDHEFVPEAADAVIWAIPDAMYAALRDRRHQVNEKRDSRWEDARKAREARRLLDVLSADPSALEQLGHMFKL